MNSYDVFIEVVELESFSAAAKKMLLSPSTVSKQIGMLEHRLGVQLFNRTTRSLSLTHAGELYYARCKDISHRMELAEAELKDLAQESSGKLTITWPNVLSNSDIVKVLGDFSREYPNIKVRVKVSNEMLNLTDEKIDLAFRVAELDDSSMVAIKLSSIQPLVCASPDLVETHGVPESLPEVLQYPHVIPTYYNLAQLLRTKYPEITRLDIDKHHEVDDIFTLNQMALQGMGAAFLFQHMVEKELAEGSLIDITQNEKLPMRSVYLVYPKLDYMPKPMRFFIDYFKLKFLHI